MAEPAASVSIDPIDFERLILLYISKLGFETESTEKVNGSTFDIIAKTTNPIGGRIISLIRSTTSAGDVTQTDVEDLYESMSSHGAVRGAFITVADFTDEAKDYARGKPISLINRYQLTESIERHGLSSDSELIAILERYGLSEKHYGGEEHVFISNLNEEQAKAYFERIRKKKVMGLFGTEELTKRIEKRYAPLNVFKIKKLKRFEEQGLRKIQSEEYLYVNLNTAELYYIKAVGKRRATGYAIKSSNVLSEIFDLPVEARTHLLDLLEHGDLPLKTIAGKHLSILESKRVIQIYEGKKRAGGNVDMMMSVLQDFLDLLKMFIDDIAGGLAGLGESSKGSSSKGPAEPEKNVAAQLNLPHVSGGIYDLKEYLVIEKESLDDEGERDFMAYKSKDISSLMGRIFDGVIISKGIIHMPYYRCGYIDKKAHRLLKYEILVSPKFKPLEGVTRVGEAPVRPDSGEEGGEVRKKYSSEKYGIEPYKLIR